jgi:nitric oxide reductase NorD protein
MEELIGKFWDRWITSKAATDFPSASVCLGDLQGELKLYFRALGGEPAKTLEPAERRKLRVKRTGLQRVAGSHQSFYLPWLDARSVRLPPTLSIFPDKNQNEALYFWLAAMAARLSGKHCSVYDNQQAVLALTARYPGLKTMYASLLDASLVLRPEPTDLQEDLRQRERAVRRALEHPGRIDNLPYSHYDVMPVPLWLYPAPTLLASVPVQSQDPEDEVNQEKRPHAPKKLAQRKQAQRIDDTKETDGLLVFLPDSLMSWTEQVNVDRCQDDEDDSEPVARDVDLITLSRQRKAAAAKVKFDLDLPAEENDELRLGSGIRLPEWHYKKRQLIPNTCLLQPMISDDVIAIDLPPHLKKASLDVRRMIETIGLTRQRLKAQFEGQELDLDAWIDGYAQPVKNLGKQNFYIDQREQIRDFSCLILADLSLSTEGYVNDEQQVIDVIRDSLQIFSEALSQLRDEFAIYGFSSVRNSHIRYHLIKHFGEQHSPLVRGRIARIKPGYYTRMGAAIRQSGKILQERPEAHRVLLILSDGKPNDLDQYEGRYGIEDTRQAIIEARKLGVTPYCVTIDADGHDYLPYLFGRDGFTVVTQLDQLPRILPRVYMTLSTQ